MCIRWAVALLILIVFTLREFILLMLLLMMFVSRIVILQIWSERAFGCEDIFQMRLLEITNSYIKENTNETILKNLV